MPKRRPRNKDFKHVLQEHAGSEAADDDATAGRQQFSKRSKFQQHNKTLVTAAERMADAGLSAERKRLPLGQVVQVYSLFSEVEPQDAAVAEAARRRTGSGTFLCTARRTMRKLIGESHGEVVVGDMVRFRPNGGTTKLPSSEGGQLQAEGVIEAALPRRTILTRVDSFEEHKQDPIVANADRFLIVASMHNPFPRFGLIDRMLVAAQAGGLRPAVVVNKADLAPQAEDAAGTLAALDHYRTALGIEAFTTSILTGEGLDQLRAFLSGQVTVLAGHSGVGKSSLVNAVQPQLDLRVGEVSETHSKGRHTTTSARRYPLDDPAGGAVIDTPGVKVFGLWGVSGEALLAYFPDVVAGSAPAWRVESYERILASLSGSGREEPVAARTEDA